MTALGMVVMTGILTAEIFIVGQQGGALGLMAIWCRAIIWPKQVPRVLVAAVSDKRPANSLPQLFVTIILSVVTGERINFLIRACGGMLAGLVWRPNLADMRLVLWNC